MYMVPGIKKIAMGDRHSSRSYLYYINKLIIEGGKTYDASNR